MSTDQHAYSTDAPEVVAAYRQALVDHDALRKRLRADVAALGAGPQVYLRTSGFPGVPNRITAIEQDGDHIPDGWRLVRGMLEPRRGKPGEAARKWLDDHQLPDVRHVMEQHGLPRSSWVPRDQEFGWTIVTPIMFEHNGTVWACYEGDPGTSGSGFDTKRCTWTPRKRSEFYAALEAHEAANPPAEDQEEPGDGGQ